MDEGLLLGIDVRHGEKPGVITTNTAKWEYETKGVLDRASESLNYAEVLSNNTFADKQLGAVLGSPHPGDDVLKQWGALAGEAITDNGKRGRRRSYGPIGNDILRHFRESQVLQAILRFGRNDDDSDVYVHTSALPEWIDAKREYPGYFDGELKRQVVDYLRSTDRPITRPELIDETGISKSHVYEVVDELKEAEFVRLTDGVGNEGKQCRWVA
jgi:hypothetical protein